MNRRIISTITLSCVAFAGVAKQRPNVLVVITDEQSFRTIGAYRETLPQDAAEPWGKGNKVDTPNLDYLASQGVLCTSYYASDPVSSPSRSSLVSGMYPEKTYVVKNDVHMNDNIETFAQTLLDNGYVTGYAGKWHLDGEDKPGWAPKAKFGFEDNRYMFNRGHFKVAAEDETGPHIAVNAAGKELYPKSATEESFTTDFLTDRAVNFIKNNGDKTFCYMLSIPDPHTPNSVRAPYDTMYKDQQFTHPVSADIEAVNLPKWIFKGGSANKSKTIVDMPGQMASYWGMVKCIDDNMGKLISTLKAEGIFDNTIIVFTSDHGDMLGEHHHDNKGLAFETSAKVPFIIYYKDKLKAGVVNPYAMVNTDFAPTILSLMDVKSSVKYDGRDCADMFITNELPKAWNNVAVFGHGNSWLASTNGEYKMICPLKGGSINTEIDPIVFNTKSDPMEIKDIFASAPASVKKVLYSAIDDHCKEFKGGK